MPPETPNRWCDQEVIPRTVSSEQKTKRDRGVDSGLLKKTALCGLLHAFFAQACTGSSTLTGFEFRVALANDIQCALALHDLTIGVTALHGGE